MVSRRKQTQKWKNVGQQDPESKSDLLKVPPEQGEKHLPVQGWGGRQEGNAASDFALVGSVCSASIQPFLRRNSHQPISVLVVKRD